MKPRVVANTLAVLVAAAVAFPIFWMIVSALPVDNFRRVLTVENFALYFANSVVVALVVVIASGLIAFLSAVALTRFNFRFRTTILVLFLIAQMAPIEALTIPLFFLVRDLGALNTLGSLMLVHTAFTLPFAIWMMRGFVAGVPVEIEEAAALDGASRLTILYRVLFPLVAPGLAATSVFSFITAWNDFLFARTFIISATDSQTLPLALLIFFKPDENDWGAIMAASTLMTIPVLIFFLLVRRRLSTGLGGAVKD